MSEKELPRYDLLIKVGERRMSQKEAAELLGISDRHFRRLWKAYQRDGAQGIISKRRGKPSNNRFPKDLLKQIKVLLKSRYYDFGPTLAKEKLWKEHQIKVSHETVRKIMIEEELWIPRKRKRLKLHQSRPRRSHKGELVQVDGSPHAWFEERGPKCNLLAYIDDATSEVMHLKFVKSESVHTYFETLKEYMLLHGKPQAFYTDRLSVFRINNAKEGYRGLGLTQVGRGLKELGIELICANSPQAKGRVERLFKTLQDRLVKELRLLNINTVEEANAYLPKYIEEYNKAFAIPPLEESDFHEKIEENQLKDVLRSKVERTLTKNLEISYNNRILQIITDRPGYAMRKAKVQVIEETDGQLEIIYKGKSLQYKELLVRDRQGRIMNRKEVTGATLPLMRGRVA